MPKTLKTSKGRKSAPVGKKKTVSKAKSGPQPKSMAAGPAAISGPKIKNN